MKTRDLAMLKSKFFWIFRGPPASKKLSQVPNFHSLASQFFILKNTHRLMKRLKAGCRKFLSIGRLRNACRSKRVLPQRPLRRSTNAASSPLNCWCSSPAISVPHARVPVSRRLVVLLLLLASVEWAAEARGGRRGGKGKRESNFRKFKYQPEKISKVK